MTKSLHPAFAPSSTASKPIWCVDDGNWKAVRERLPAEARAFADASGFKPDAGQSLILPDAKGGVVGCLFGLGKRGTKHADPLLAGRLAAVLPEGDWKFAEAPRNARLATIAFALGAYRFAKYREDKKRKPRFSHSRRTSMKQKSRASPRAFIFRAIS